MTNQMTTLIKEVQAIKDMILIGRYTTEVKKHLQELKREINNLEDIPNELLYSQMEVNVAIALNYTLSNSHLREAFTKDIIEGLPVSLKLLGSCFTEVNSKYRMQKVGEEWLPTEERLGDYLRELTQRKMAELIAKYNEPDIVRIYQNTLKDIAVILREEEEERQDVVRELNSKYF